MLKKILAWALCACLMGMACPSVLAADPFKYTVHFDWSADGDSAGLNNGTTIEPAGSIAVDPGFISVSDIGGGEKFAVNKARRSIGGRTETNGVIMMTSQFSSIEPTDPPAQQNKEVVARYNLGTPEVGDNINLSPGEKFTIEFSLYFEDFNTTRLIDLRSTGYTDVLNIAKDSGNVTVPNGSSRVTIMKANPKTWYRFAMVFTGGSGAYDVYINQNKVTKYYSGSNAIDIGTNLELGKNLDVVQDMRIISNNSFSASQTTFDPPFSSQTAFDDIAIYNAEPSYATNPEPIKVTSTSDDLVIDEMLGTITFNQETTATQLLSAMVAEGGRGSMTLVDASGQPLEGDAIVSGGAVLRLTYTSAGIVIIAGYTTVDESVPTATLIKKDNFSTHAYDLSGDNTSGKIGTIIRGDDTKGIGGRDADDISLGIKVENETVNLSTWNPDPYITYINWNATGKNPQIVEASIYLDDSEKSKTFFQPRLNQASLGADLIMVEKGWIHVKFNNSFKPVMPYESNNWYHFTCVLNESELTTAHSYDVYINHNKINHYYEEELLHTEKQPSFLITQKVDDVDVPQPVSFVRGMKLYTTYQDYGNGSQVSGFTAFDDLYVYAGVEVPFADEPVGVDTAEETIIINEIFSTIELDEDITVENFMEKISSIGGRGALTLLDSARGAEVSEGNVDDGMYLRLFYDSVDHGVIIRNYKILRPSEDEYVFEFDTTTTSNEVAIKLDITNNLGNEIKGKLIAAAYDIDGRLMNAYIGEDVINVDAAAGSTGNGSIPSFSLVGVKSLKAFFWSGESLGGMDGVAMHPHEFDEVLEETEEIDQ